jgi:bifunctional non-homologous end joining protein LigD
VVASACKLGLEGVIAKRLDSTYVSRRSTAWIKLKCSQRQEFVIGGYTDPQGSRVGIGALLLGVHDKSRVLQYAGKVGTGFDDRTLGSLKARLDKLTTAKSPFSKAAAIEGRPHWVKPQLVAEVSFGEWTRAGIIRHSVFHGLRADKPAGAIVRERPAAKKKVAKRGGAAAANESHALNPSLRVTHPERVIDPSTGITKIELVRYYGLVGDLMMAHLKGRPVSLVRAPRGVDGQLFFQKHAETEKLPGIRQLDPALYISHPPLLEIADRRGILSAAQWNVVEFHTQNTGTKSLQHADRMIFDLDPGEGVAWAKVRDAARLVHAFLKELGLPAFLKTSGGKGLHVVVPLHESHDWDTVKGFSKAVVIHLAKTIPQRFVAKSGPKNRVGKIFVDYLRNRVGATTACGWTARARPGLGISVPVAWEELSSLKGGDHWTVRTAHVRLDKGNRAWDGYARSACRLTAAMQMLNYPAGTST